MLNKEILQKAVAKARKNGFNFCPTVLEKTLINATYDEAIFYNNNYNNDIIFSHEFAKAFWGEEIMVTSIGNLLAWKFHLQQMVLKEAPLKYIEKFLEV